MLNRWNFLKTGFYEGIKLSLPGGELIGHCKFAIAPIPPRAALPGTKALRLAAFWVEVLKNQDWLPDRDIVLRPFLIRSNKFKSSFLNSDAPRALSAAYRELPMPRYIWVVEFAFIDDWQHKAPDQLTIRGEFIFDSTLSSVGVPDFLAIHIPGSLIVRRVTGHDIQTEPRRIRNDRPYPIISETSRP